MFKDFYKIILFALLFSACSFRPDMPNVQTNIEDNATLDYSAIKDKWWEEFKDDELNALMNSALANNNDLLLAQINLEKAGVSLNLARIEFLPNVGLEGSRGKTRTSGLTQTGMPSSKYNLSSLNAAASWEIDLWGRIRNTNRAANALFEASQADYENARLSIAASVANTYFNLVALSDQENILKQTLKSYEETLEIRKAQFESGMITDLIYEQAVASVASARNDLASLQDALISTRTALAILAGKDSEFILKDSVKINMKELDIPEVPDGISADILERRADVYSALKRLKAANAQIGVARANYFPQISLTGLFGYASTEFNRLINSTANTWQIGGSLVMPLLDFGRTYNQVELAWLDQNASMLEYDKTLKNALGEVRDALELRKNANEKLHAAQALNIAQNKVYELSKLRYEAGYSSHLEFLDAQRMLLAARLNYASAKAGVANSVVEVYKALGGGFKSIEPLKENLDEGRIIFQ